MRRKTRSFLTAAAAGAVVATISSQVNAQSTIYYDPVVSVLGDGTSTLTAADAYTTSIDVFSKSVAGQTGPLESQSYSGLTNSPSTAEMALANNPGVADAAAADTSYVGPAYVYSGGYAGADASAFAAENRIVGDMTVTSTAVTNPTLGASYASTLAYSGSTIRGAVGDDTASNFWTAGNGSGTTGSFRYWNTNVQVSGQATFNGGALALETNTRTVQILNGQLYGSSDTGQFIGVSMIGTGTPTPAAPTTPDGSTSTLLFQTGTTSATSSPYSFLLIDDPNNPSTPTLNSVTIPYNVAYIADNGQATGVDTTSGIQKWTYNPANLGNGNNGWSLAYTIGDNTHVDTNGAGYYGLAGQLLTNSDSADDSVVLYTTTSDTGTNTAGGNILEQFTDQLDGSTSAATDSTQINLATAPSNELFRGVALAPIVAANITWSDAAANSLWDTVTSSNWNNGNVNTVFNPNDNVTLNDNNGANAGRYAVMLNTVVSPGSVLVNNSNSNYTISGAGGIGGTGSLTKTGSATLTVSTANTYTGGTTVNGGTLLIEPTGNPATSALPTGTLSIGNAGEVQLATNTTLGSQSSNTPITAPTSNINITTLSIAGNGTLDIGNNHIIIDYHNVIDPDPIASIVGWIKSGYNNGTWTGPGITSSAAAANASSYGIGYADSADPGNPAGLSAGQIEIMYTLLGDANLDGKVNGADFTILASNFNQSGKFWDQGDFNYDGDVNGGDFTLLAKNFNQTAIQSAVAADDLTALDDFAASNGISLTTTSVPEPASIGLLAAGTLALTARRRSRRR